MPRSSRSKSHKQSKHSSKEHSDFDEDVKMKERNTNNDGKVPVRVSKDSSVSGEKRKMCKDLSDSYVNGNVSEERTTPSKRRKDKSYGGSDRWNGDGVEEKAEVVNMANTKVKSKDLLKVVGESKSKTSRRHDVDSASVVVAEKEESKNGNRGEKRSEKESGRKEVHQFKENRELKDKDRGSARERKIQDGKHADEAISKQVEDQPSKRGRRTNVWRIEEELRNIDLEKELEKRIRRRDRSFDKDRYQDDLKDDYKRTLSMKNGRAKDTKHKDEKHKDKHREDDERVGKNRVIKYQVDSEKDRDNRHKHDKYRNRDDKHDRDHTHKEERYREDVRRHKNGRPRDDTDREKRVKDSNLRDADRRRNNDKDESTDYNTRSESKKRFMNNAKVDAVSERGRPGCRDDVDIVANNSRHRSSPSGKFYPSRTHYRVSKQEETKHRDHVHEERARHIVNSDFTSAPAQSDNISSQSLDKSTQEDENYIDDKLVERRLRSDQSPSSSNERRHLDNDGKGSRKLAMEAHPDNSLSQKDSENLSVSSPYTRNGHFSGNYKSLLPADCHRRLSDPKMGRPESNWKNVPNWPSSLANNGYIPFLHVPPPIFHPVMQQMQQFAPPIFGRPSVNGFSGHRSLVTWRNPVEESFQPPLFCEESNGHVRLDWDNGRTQLDNRMWESSDHSENEIWSGQTGRNFDNEQHQLDIIIQTVTAKNAPEPIKVITESPCVSEVLKEDDAVISRVYLSKIDVSEDLTRPEFYDECASLLDLDQVAATDEFDCKILFLDDGIEVDISNGASLFAAIDDSVFKKAMSLYTKNRNRVSEVNQEKDEASIKKLDTNYVIKDSGDNKELFDKSGSLLSVNISRIHINSH